MSAMDMELLAMHGLAVKKAAEAGEVARIMGLSADDVTKALEVAAAGGDAMGAKGKYMLTPQGRQRLDAAYPEEFADLRTDERFVAAYDRFERVNRQLKQLMTEWQTMDVSGEQIANDHSDPDYDAGIIDRLGELHEQFEPTIRQLADAVDRLDLYRQRLDAAYDRALGGETDYVSGVRVDSYHTVWFELHEDLLRLLGRTREE
jgi:hypothetical protein